MAQSLTTSGLLRYGFRGGQLKVADREAGSVAGQVPAVEVEKAASVPIEAVRGIPAEDRLQVDEFYAALGWDGLTERIGGEGVGVGVAVVGCEAGVDFRGEF